ncbi:peptidoglycan bridge formation glycyltransferase FemA/FemB family protein [Candidatus Saccharibacteria bacterium]|nr:peptidoglycan bridge formation glycyltransferase FemA/FemB family protein [Candidatus Saccharibacteria bacterium]
MEKYKILELTEEEYLCFIKTQETNNFRAQSISYFREMFDAFGKKIKVVAAFYEEKPISAAMFILCNNEIIYLYSGSDYKYNKYCGSYAIQWYMIKFALENNYKIYNFYGARPFPGDGVYEFKKGFQAETVEKMGVFGLPLDMFGKVYLSTRNYRKFGKIS